MEAFKFHITVESDTIKIPELKRFLGRRVEVILLDDSRKEKGSSSKFKKLKDLKGKISFDDNALSALRKDSIL
jgi:hypothetical protein